MKSLVVAVDKNMGIGAGNDLPWGMRALKDDQANFKRITNGGSLIMGRLTFESIGKPLPDRENIVVTSKPTAIEGVLSAVDLPSAYELARYPIFVIGGGKIYAEAIDHVDRMYITEVDASFDNVMVYFPNIDKSIWYESSREHHTADDRNKYAFDFVVYDKK